jgi:uncharacterized protein
MELMIKIANEIVNVFIEAAPYVMLGLLLAGVFGRLISRAWVLRQLGGRSFWAVVKAAALGAPLPICSCGVIPTTVGLHRAGAGRPAVMSFLISTPETGVDSITITWFLINPLMTVARPVVAVFSAMAGGLAAIIFDKDKPDTLPVVAESACCCGHKAAPVEPAVHSCCAESKENEKSDCCEGEHEEESCCATKSETDSAGVLEEEPSKTMWGRVTGVFAFGFGEVLGAVAPWLLVGLILAGAAGALIPPDFFTASVSNPWAQMALMALIATPLYLCSVSTTPVAAMLMLKGMHPGAALVLLTLGPATNITTIIVIAREFGARFTAIYMGTILWVSFAAGAALNAITSAVGEGRWWTELRMSGSHVHAHAAEQPALWAVASALALAFLLGYHLILKRWAADAEPVRE